MQTCKKVCSVISFFLILSIFPQVSMAQYSLESISPLPAGSTGYSGDANGTTACAATGCHTTYFVNAGTGTFSIAVSSGGSDVTTYTAGTDYTVTVSLTDTNMARSGFQSTTSAGTVAVSDATHTKLNSDTSYIQYLADDTGSFVNETSASWSYTWTAPSSGTGDVTIYAGGVAANNADLSLNDYVYTTTTTLTEVVGADTTDPSSGKIVINGVGIDTTDDIGVTLILSATDDTGVTGYYVSETSTEPTANTSGWVTVTSIKSYSANVSFVMSTGQGTKTVYVWFKDAAGNISTVAFDTIISTYIPTLSEWGIIIATLLLMVSGGFFLRRNRILN